MDKHKVECQGCGLSPNVRSGDAVIWCDECYSDLQDKLARMQPVVDAVGKHIMAIREELSGRTIVQRLINVSECWDKYTEGE